MTDAGPAANRGNTKVLWTVAGKVAHPLAEEGADTR